MRMITLSALSLLLAGYVTVAGAQTEQKTTTHSKVRTLTGCLQKSDKADEYRLTTASGSTWEVKSDKVNLGEHVGHEVAVTGTVSHASAHGMKEDAKQEAQEHGMTKSDAEHGHLTATELKMVSETCKK